MTTQETIEIGKANEVLKQAYELVSEAYQLILNNPAAKKHLDFNCTVGWDKQTWNKLNEEYVIENLSSTETYENPSSTETYHLRAFDYFGLQCGRCISLNGMAQTNGG